MGEACRMSATVKYGQNQELLYFYLWVYEIKTDFSKTQAKFTVMSIRDFPVKGKAVFCNQIGDLHSSVLVQIELGLEERRRKASLLCILNQAKGRMGPGNGCHTFWCTPAPQRCGNTSSKGSDPNPFFMLAGKWCWGNSPAVLTAGFTYSSTSRGILPIVGFQRQMACSGYIPADAQPKLCKRTRTWLNLCVNEGSSCEDNTGVYDVPAWLWSTFLGRSPGQKIHLFMLEMSSRPQ